jgi:hypothetical protein
VCKRERKVEEESDERWRLRERLTKREKGAL